MGARIESNKSNRPPSPIAPGGVSIPQREYKVVISEHEGIINDLIRSGWIVDSVTAGHVAAVTGSYSTSQKYNGNFCFVLSRAKKE